MLKTLPLTLSLEELDVLMMLKTRNGQLSIDCENYIFSQLNGRKAISITTNQIQEMRVQLIVYREKSFQVFLYII